MPSLSSSSPSTFTPFQYRLQPWKFLYLTSTVSYTLLFRLPYHSIRCLFPSLRSGWSYTRALMIPLIRVFCETLYATGLEAMIVDPSKRPKDADADKRGWVLIPPLGALEGELAELAARNGLKPEPVGGYWFGVRGEDGLAGQRAGEGEKVVLYLHSGGYVMGTATDALATSVIQALLSLDWGRVFAPEYHVARSSPSTTANPWPTQLIDALAAYTYLCSLGFAGQILVCGDSAGGHLAFALAQHLSHQGEAGTLPSPAGLLLLSPTMDFTLSSWGPSSSLVRNAQTDGLQAVFLSQYSVNSLRGTLSVQEWEEDALCSPGSRSAPRTFVHSCGGELALDSITLFVQRMGKDVQVRYEETGGVTHDLLATGWQEPERGELLALIKQWLDGL